MMMLMLMRYGFYFVQKEKRERMEFFNPVTGDPDAYMYKYLGKSDCLGNGGSHQTQLVSI
jgi:hypothetical protein